MADGRTPLDEVIPRLLDLVVPALADCCALYGDGGESRIVGVRVAGSDAGYEAAIRERPAPQIPADARLLGEHELAGYGSGVLLPLRARGQPTGAIVLATRAPESYAPADLRFLQVFAGRLAVALDNARLLTAERQLEALIGAMEDAVTVLDAGGRIVMANEAAARLMGAGSVEQLIATEPADLWERFALYDADGRPLPKPERACCACSRERAGRRRSWCAASTVRPATSAGCSPSPRSCSTIATARRWRCT